MLPKPHCLTQKKDFKRVVEQGRSFFVKEFGIKSIPHRRGVPTRIGIVVPKKITGTIVKRNRIKRQVRHIFLRLVDDLAPGYDIVFFARPNFLNLKFKEMQEKIMSVLKRIHLIKWNVTVKI